MDKQYFDNLTEKTIESEEIFNGHILHLFNDRIELPNGHESTREVIRHVGAVAIVPVTDDGKVVIERQFRYPLNSVITEIPAGKLDGPDEDRLEAAKRELREETGIVADDWLDMGEYYPAAAYCDEKLNIYLARGLHTKEQELDEDEFLNIEYVPLADLVQEVMDGKITDGKTQVGIMKAAKILGA